MPSRGFLQVYLLFFLSLFVSTSYGQNASVTIPLNKTLTWADKELYGGFAILKATSTIQVNLTNPDASISFVIFQVHSHLHNVTLYSNTLVPQSVIVGTNIGLYSSVKPMLDTFYILNRKNFDIQIHITVHGYDKDDPIPGGCNMEFPTAIAPYIQTTINKDFILVDLAPPKDSKDLTCQSSNDVSVVFYKMYLPVRLYFDEELYFSGIQSMSTLDKIVNNGGFIPENTEHMRRRVATYRSMGVVYVAIAYSNTNKSAYSVYVPNAVYSCDPFDKLDCNRLDALTIIMCICLYIVGITMCFYGHYYFKAEMFVMGTLSGVILTYIVISLIAVVDPPALLGASLLSGIGFGAIWLLFWWFYGIPLFSVCLPTLNVGFLFAATIYYALPGGLLALQLDLNFWALFITITLMTSLMLLSMTFLSNILCCVIVGSYAVIFSMGFMIGTNMNYIIINTIRRAVVPNFNKVVLIPPFGWMEALDIVFWVIMVVAGFMAQRMRNRGRPPFPPPPRSVRPAMPGLSYGTIGQENHRPQNDRPFSGNPSTVNTESAPLLA